MKQTAGWLFVYYMKNVYDNNSPRALDEFQEQIFCAIMGLSQVEEKDFEAYYADLVFALVRFAFKKYNAVAGIGFGEMPALCQNANAAYNPNENFIALNKNVFKFPEPEKIKNASAGSVLATVVRQLASNYITIIHEFAHAQYNNWCKNASKVPNSIALSYVLIPRFSEIFPDKKEAYENFAKSCYFVNQDEVFAEKSGHLALVDFMKKLNAYARKSLPEAEKHEAKTHSLSKQEMQEFCQKLSLKELEEMIAISIASTLEKTAIEKMNRYENELQARLVQKQNALPEITKDFLAYAQKFIDMDGKMPITETDIYWLNRRVFESVFLAEKFIKYNQKGQDLKNPPAMLRFWKQEKARLLQKREAENCSIEGVCKQLEK